MVGANKPGRRPKGVSKWDAPTVKALKQREYAARKKLENMEAVMSDEEKTYRDRLGEVVEVISGIRRRAYFSGREELQEELTELEQFAQNLLQSPVNYNKTTGAVEPETEEVAAE